MHVEAAGEYVVSREKNRSFSFLHFEKPFPPFAEIVDSLWPKVCGRYTQQPINVTQSWSLVNASDASLHVTLEELSAVAQRTLAMCEYCTSPLGYDLYFYWTTVTRPCSIANNTPKIEGRQLPQQRLTQKVKLHLCNTPFPGSETSLPLVSLYLFRNRNRTPPSLSMLEGSTVSVIPSSYVL